MSQKSGRKPDVAILGAGLAGLSAAYELTRAGYRVEVLEARSRPGGRILTLRSDFADGMYAEAGAMSFPDTESFTMKYVTEFDLGLQTHRRPHEFNLYFLKNRLLRDSDRNAKWPGLRADEQKLGPRGLFEKYILPAVNSVGHPLEPGWPSEKVRHLDRLSGPEFLIQQGASPGAAKLLGLGLFDEDGDGFADCSALFLFAWLAVLLKFSSLYTIKGGMDRLPLAFADRLRERIHYGAPVTHISQTRSGVKLTYVQAGREKELEADRAICTIPYSVLRDIRVSPGFSARKQRIIRELPNTSVLRIYLQTRTRFWEQGDFSGQAFTDLPIQSLYSAYDRPGVRGIFECYLTGNRAHRMAKKSPEAQMSAALDGMGRVFPEFHEQTEGGMLKNWDEDPWSRGAYAWYKPGQFLDVFPHVRTPEGRIHFAGDHTSLMPGWMEGAFVTSDQAVREIRDRRQR